MALTTQNNEIIERTKELCQSIVDSSDYQTLKKDVDEFLANEEAKFQYQSLVEKGDYLTHKQQQGVTLSEEEVADFQQHRDTVVNNPVAKKFLDAQRELHKVQESVSQYITKTLELGRVPTDEDLDGGGCGHGCGCSH